MGVTMTWDEASGNVVVMTFTEEWTWREALRQLERSIPLVEHANLPVFYIVDLTATTFLPGTGLIDAVKQGAALVKPLQTIKGAILVMKPNPMRDMLITALTSYGVRGHTILAAQTLDEALRLSAQTAT